MTAVSSLIASPQELINAFHLCEARLYLMCWISVSCVVVSTLDVECFCAESGGFVESILGPLPQNAGIGDDCLRVGVGCYYLSSSLLPSALTAIAWTFVEFSCAI